MSLRDELDLGAFLDAEAAEEAAHAVRGGDGVGLDRHQRHAALLRPLEHRGAGHVVAGEHHGHGGRVQRGEHDLGAVAADDDDLVGRELEVPERVLGAHGADHVGLDEPLAVALAADEGAVQRLDDLGDGDGREHGARDQRPVALDVVLGEEARVLVLHERQAGLGHHVEEDAQEVLLEGVLDVDDVVEQPRAGELGHEQGAEVELGHHLGAAGAQEPPLPDLAETLADDDVLAGADALVGGLDARHRVDLGAAEDVVQRVLVEDDGADVGEVVLELEQLGDELGVLVEQHLAGVRRQRADGLEVAGVQPPAAQGHAEADGDGRLAAAALGGGDVERSQHRSAPSGISPSAAGPFGPAAAQCAPRTSWPYGH